jgi:hypothetical protein
MKNQIVEGSLPQKHLQRSQSMSALMLGSPSPHNVAKAQSLLVPGQLRGAEGLLTIGSLNIPVVAPAAPAAPAPADAQGKQGKLQKSPALIAARSAPQLPGPSPMPRLLMQSVY